jgi:uncharacterized cupredoxin-like copper-binding protein
VPRAHGRVKCVVTSGTGPPPRSGPRLRPVIPERAARLALAVLACGLAAACDASAPVSTPPIVPGSSGAPREVNLITKDYSYLPDVLDLVPGETVLLHVVNGGLATHEAVIGDAATQEAWAAAEAGTDGAPPGPTPVVSVAPDVAGVRIVVTSGERVDVVWTVPSEADIEPYVVACHIPGHLERGMQIPVRWVPAP